MAHTKFGVEILTPEGEVFNEEVEMVSTRTTVGTLGILANHAPLLATLEPTELRVYRTESDVVRFAQGEGYLQVQDNHALILVQDAVDPGSLDPGALRNQLSDAETALGSHEEGTEGHRQAEREIRRLQVFLALAEGT
jgi:F-type H+-transporting ATPase subunit epsilon